MPTVVQDATEQYRSDMDPLRDFVADCCVLHPNAWTLASGLRQAYEQFCKENGRETPHRAARVRGGAERSRLFTGAPACRAWLARHRHPHRGRRDPVTCRDPIFGKFLSSALVGRSYGNWGHEGSRGHGAPTGSPSERLGTTGRKTPARVAIAHQIYRQRFLEAVQWSPARRVRVAPRFGGWHNAPTACQTARWWPRVGQGAAS